MYADELKHALWGKNVRGCSGDGDGCDGNEVGTGADGMGMGMGVMGMGWEETCGQNKVSSWGDRHLADKPTR